MRLQYLSCTYSYAVQNLAMDEVNKTSKKVKIGNQYEAPMAECEGEALMLLFTCIRVADRIRAGKQDGNVYAAVEDSKHILAEVIGAKECSCNMCMCDVLAENSLLGKGGLN